MPKVSIPTPEITSSVIRPAILDIVNQVMAITNIPKDSRIQFLGELDSAYQRGSTLQQGEDRVGLSYDNKVTVQVESNFNEGSVLSTAVRHAEHTPVFNDTALGILIKPIYSKMDFTINFEFRSESETSGKNWRNAIKTHISMMRDINLHEITYHYPIPFQYVSILKEIYKLREAIAPYNQDLETYLSSCSTPRLTAISNQSGSQTELAVTEKQVRILGLYDFTISPEKGSRTDGGNAWVTTFSYNVSFDVPHMVNMEYPIMIHNQMLEFPYVPTEVGKDYNIKDMRKTLSMSSLTEFESNVDTDKAMVEQTVVRIPSMDQFVPTSQPYATQPLFTALCNVDTVDMKILLNLKELGDFSLDTDVLRFLEDEYPYLTVPTKSIFHISLYKWSALVNDKEITVDKDLNVYSTVDLSMRVNHRVVFSAVTDIGVLDKRALIRLKKHRNAAIKVLKAIKVTRMDLQNVSHQVNLLNLMPDLPYTGTDIQSFRNQLYQFNTVQSAYVITRDGFRSDKIEDAPYPHAKK